MQILIADKEKLIQNTLEEFLCKCGYDVFCADSAQEVIDIINEEVCQINVLIVDLRLAMYDGVNILEYIKEISREIDVILLSGYGNDLTIRQAIEMGAVSVQRKPISLQELELVLKQVHKKEKKDWLIKSMSKNIQKDKVRELSNIQDRQYLRRMHKRLIPRRFDWLKHCNAAIRYLPMSGIGGDYLDLKNYGESKILVFLADVSGSGLPAAFAASAFKIWFNAIEIGLGCNQVLASVDQIVKEVLPEEYLVTAFCGIYDETTNILEYSLAGHLEPIIIRNTGETICLYADGPALGLCVESEFTVCRQQLNQGDSLLVYTDGLTDHPEELAAQLGADYKNWRSVQQKSRDYLDRLITFIVDEAAILNPSRAFADDIAVLLLSPKVPSPAGVRDNITGKRVLVVDDNKEVCSLINEILLLEQAQTMCMNDTVGIIHVIENYCPDMVIMDIFIPNSDGVSCMEHIHSKWPSLPVLLMTGEDPQSQVKIAVRKKAAGLLAKPFSLSTFKDTVNAALEYSSDRDDVQIDLVSNDWLDCVISSSPNSLQMLTNYLVILNKQPIPEEVLDDLIYCIREIAGNAIEWGNHHDPGLKVRLSTVLLEDRALVRIQDEGGGFNAKKMFEMSEDIIASQQERHKQGKRDGGFGLAIVKAKVDHISFNEIGNSTVLTKFFNSGENYKAPLQRDVGT